MTQVISRAEEAGPTTVHVEPTEPHLLLDAAALDRSFSPDEKQNEDREDFYGVSRLPHFSVRWQSSPPSSDHKATTLNPCESDLWNVCRLLVPGWKALPEGCFSLTPIKGGITNMLFRISVIASCLVASFFAGTNSFTSSSDAPPPTKRPRRPQPANHANAPIIPMPEIACVLVRLYGAKTEVVLDRQRDELVTVWLGPHGFGPGIYGMFANGRIEKWIEGRTLQPQDMCADLVRPHIAYQLARLHAQKVPISRDCALWTSIDKWVSIAMSNPYKTPEQQRIYDSLDLPALLRLVKQMKTLFEHYNKKMNKSKNAGKSESKEVDDGLVFCHNDLLAYNIMLPKNGSVQFIDLEYSGYNPPAFDIANHLFEYAGFECDLSRLPDAPLRRAFIKEYLSAKHCFTSTTPPVIEDSTLDAFHRCVLAYMVLDNFFWGVWALVQAIFSTVDFDYMGYAKMRLDTFKNWLKAEPFASAIADIENDGDVATTLMEQN